MRLMFDEEHPGAIATTTIDELLKHSQHDVALIKTDCEGMDYKIITGALKTIQRCQPIVAFEAETKEKLDEIAGFLKPLGYVKTFKTNKRPASFVWQWRL